MNTLTAPVLSAHWSNGELEAVDIDFGGSFAQEFYFKHDAELEAYLNIFGVAQDERAAIFRDLDRVRLGEDWFEDEPAYRTEKPQPSSWGIVSALWAGFALCALTAWAVWAWMKG